MLINFDWYWGIIILPPFPHQHVKYLNNKKKKASSRESVVTR